MYWLSFHPYSLFFSILSLKNLKNKYTDMETTAEHKNSNNSNVGSRLNVYPMCLIIWISNEGYNCMTLLYKIGTLLSEYLAGYRGIASFFFVTTSNNAVLTARELKSIIFLILIVWVLYYVPLFVTTNVIINFDVVWKRRRRRKIGVFAPLLF